MHKRSENKKKFPGYWSIPGGHVDVGEDVVSAAIREVEEEVGIFLSADDLELKVQAIHRHIDRGETYVAFGFIAKINDNLRPEDSDEGINEWVDVSEALVIEKVFTPIKYYFKHVLNNEPGVIFNSSDWENIQLVKVHSQSIIGR